MMHLIQQRLQGTLALSLITCAILYTGIVYNGAQLNEISSVEKRVLIQKPLNNQEHKSIDNALENAIIYTHDIGRWLEDLFDVENNVPYIEHVENLKRTVNNIKQNLLMPLSPDENTHTTVKTTYHVVVLLLEKVEKTYEVLKSYLNSNYPFAHIGLGMALQKVLNSSRDQAEFDEVLQELHLQLETLAPELNIKLNKLKKAIKLYGDRINNQKGRTLTNGLWHRLGCKK